MTPGPEKPRRLGRGLEALLSARPAAPPPTGDATAGSEDSMAASTASTPGNELQRVRISEVRPNPYQPRKDFRDEELADLETSLKTNGLLQPITVRRAPGGRGYELIAGERRLRAAQRLGWDEIPALLRDIDDRMLATLALVENLQRADLNPIEEAEGYQRLMQDFSLTQQQVADVVGKDRTTVANTLRVLQLPASVRRMVQDKQLTLGHARALLALGNEIRIVDVARETVALGLSVRDVEKRARHAQPERQQKTEDERPRTRGAPAGRDPEARRIEDQLRRYLQTDVHLNVGAKQRGEIRIMFYSNDDLERVLELLLGTTEDEL